MSGYAGMLAYYAGDLSQQPAQEALKADGWLVCDGAPYTTTAYPDLFAAIGAAHGGGGGSFNVPDLRDRFLRGVNGVAAFGSHTVDPDAASRIAANTGGATGNAVGSLQLDTSALPISGMRTDSAAAHTHTADHLNEQSHQSWNGSTYTMARNPGSGATLDAAGSHAHALTGGDAATAPVSLALYAVIQSKNPAPAAAEEAR
jgi:microcystin-dependent protein